MPDLNPEQRARQQIDAQLVATDWLAQDFKQFNPGAGLGIALREAPLKSGTCDYLLLLDRQAVMQVVSGADAHAKTHFVIVDAVGVCESDKTDSRPLERQRTVAFDKLLLGVALGKRDEDTLTTLAGRLARLAREVSPDDAKKLAALSGGKTLSELSGALLRAIDPDAIAEKATGRGGAIPADVAPEALDSASKELTNTACAPFGKPAFRNALAKAKQDAEQTIDTVTQDTVLAQGFDATAKAKAAGLVQAFRDYLAEHQTEIDALQILYSRPFKQRLTEPMLKELEKKLRDTQATWTEDRLWDAFAVTAPGNVKGRSQAGRFADLVALVRFALEQQPVLAPFADTVHERFDSWLKSKSTPGSEIHNSSFLPHPFTAEQLAWLGLIRDHIATSLSIDPEDFEYTPFGERGGLGKAHQLFGDTLPVLLD